MKTDKYHVVIIMVLLELRTGTMETELAEVLNAKMNLEGAVTEA